MFEGKAAKVRGNPEQALSFMACASIVNAANADMPEDMDVTLNCRHVYRPKFGPLDSSGRFGNLTLTYAPQIHACVVEIDPETGELEIVDYAVVDDCGDAHQPTDRRGAGARRHRTRDRGGAPRGVHLRRRRAPADSATSRTTTRSTPWRCPISRPASSRAPPRSRRSERRASARGAAADFTRSRPRSRTRSAEPDAASCTRASTTPNASTA